MRRAAVGVGPWRCGIAVTGLLAGHCRHSRGGGEHRLQGGCTKGDKIPSAGTDHTAQITSQRPHLAAWAAVHVRPGRPAAPAPQHWELQAGRGELQAGAAYQEVLPGRAGLLLN